MPSNRLPTPFQPGARTLSHTLSFSWKGQEGLEAQPFQLRVSRAREPVPIDRPSRISPAHETGKA
jgi:hypothetical protein